MITSVIGAGVLQATESVGKTSIERAVGPSAQPERAFQPIASRFVQPVDPTDRAGNRPLREED
jgi:hypothetical protein